MQIGARAAGSEGSWCYTRHRRAGHAPSRRRAVQSELCPTICLVCSDAEVTDDESSVAGQEEEDTQRGSVASVLAAKAETFRYAALGPRGTPPVPDPRVLEWEIPETCTPERRVCLAYSTNKDVRLTYLAQAWREPRSFTTRYATLLAGLTAQQRRARLVVGFKLRLARSNCLA